MERYLFVSNYMYIHNSETTNAASRAANHNNDITKIELMLILVLKTLY